MTDHTRRAVLAGAGASLMTMAACSNGVNSNNAQKIDQRVDATLNYLFNRYPNTRELNDKSVGKLVMPVVTKAGLGLGGAFGQGALRVGGVTLDYYSVASGSVGLQIGAQQHSHVLFFMTEQALAEFRAAPGWSAGADAEYVLSQTGESASADTTTALLPVIALIFAQAGLQAGATLRGTKYTRIIP